MIGTFPCAAAAAFLNVKGWACSSGGFEGGLQDDNQSESFPTSQLPGWNFKQPLFFTSNLDPFYRWKATWKHSLNTNLLERLQLLDRDFWLCVHSPSPPFLLSTFYIVPGCWRLSCQLWWSRQGWRTTGSSTPLSTSSGDPFGMCPFWHSLRTNPWVGLDITG